MLIRLSYIKRQYFRNLSKGKDPFFDAVSIKVMQPVHSKSVHDPLMLVRVRVFGWVRVMISDLVYEQRPIKEAFQSFTLHLNTENFEQGLYCLAITSKHFKHGVQEKRIIGIKVF